jgi:hypothetical protein
MANAHNAETFHGGTYTGPPIQIQPGPPTEPDPVGAAYSASQYGADSQFASPRSEENFNNAVMALMLLTGNPDKTRAEVTVRWIAAFVMRDYVDRM